MSAAAVLLAGGSGRRAGLGRNKTLAEVAGRPLLRWAVDAFAGHVDRIVVVARPMAGHVSLLHSLAQQRQVAEQLARLRQERTQFLTVVAWPGDDGATVHLAKSN